LREASVRTEKMSSSFSLFFLLVFFVCAFSQSCPNNCSNHGTCASGVCQCDSLYGGYGTEDCSFYWVDDREYYFWWTAVDVLLALCFLLLTLYASYQLIVTFFLAWKERKTPFTVITWVLVLGLVGCTLNFASVCLPITRPYWLFNLLVNVAVSFLLAATFTLLLFWVEVQTSSGLKVVKGVRKLRPALIALIVITFLTLVPTAFVSASETVGDATEPLGAYLYAIFVIILLVSIVVISAVWGRRLVVDVRSAYNSAPHRVSALFVKKVTLFIFGVNAFLIIELILQIIQLFIIDQYPGLFVFMLVELAECGSVFLGLLIVQKRRPVQPSSALSQQDTVPTSVEMNSKNSSGSKQETI